MKEGSKRGFVRFDANLAFCSLLAIGGAVLVTNGDGGQGIVWWFLLVFLLGTLIQEGQNRVYLDRKFDRIIRSSVVGVFFLVAALCIFVLTGVGISKYTPPGYVPGIDFSKIPVRSKLLLDPLIGGTHAVIGLISIFAIWMANVAKTQTLKHFIKVKGIPDDNVQSFKFKYEAIAAAVSGVVAIVAKIAL